MSRASCSRSNGSRPPTPQEGRASITVPMCGLGWISSKTGEYTVITCVDGHKAINGAAFPGRIGMFTKGMSACFSVIVVGSGGAIMAHIPAYLGHPSPPTPHKAELKAMKAGFAQIWNAHRAELAIHTVAIIPGEFTNEGQMKALFGHIFPQVAATRAQVWPCKKTPNPRTGSHGAALVMAAPSKEIYVEDIKKM